MNTLATVARPRGEFSRAPENSRAGAWGKGNSPARSISTLIAQQSFFNGLSGSQLQVLAQAGMEMQFGAGQWIFQEESPANRFYHVLEGKVLLELEVAECRSIPIQILRPGDTLGWSWLLPPGHLRLSARALMPTRAIFFYGTWIRSQCEQDHDLGYELMKRFAEVAAQCLKATQLRLLESCSSYGMTLSGR
jgi:CRP-like cAMP-binding protein